MANTRETLGDQATLDALIAGTLTELYEDGAAYLAPYALYHNPGLETLTLPAAASIGEHALDGCAALTALVLPGETLCALAAASALENTPIAAGTGFIYVPAGMVDTYKAATNWSVYAAQIKAMEEGTA